MQEPDRVCNRPGMEKSPRGATVVVKKDGGLSLEQPTFELVDPRGQKHFFDLASVRVGAGPGNDLKLDSPTVSSVHLEIAATDRGFRVRDLGSTNGTQVDGVRVIEAYLEDGQTIRAGEVDLKFAMGKDTVRTPVSEETEFHGAVGASPAMRAVFSRVERVAKTDATVLINGETGTGKEVIAWSIYEASKRKDKPFVVVDCGGIARNLVESQLFGHEKGAFTGAHQKRLGAFERADGGTLFLDELGELELELQPKLLRALERREIQRVGGEATLKVDVRIIAATNRDLRAMVARGEFREDLYYRLAVVTTELPPLRERPEDIPPLVDKFLVDMGATRDELPDGAMARFLEHDWPGNARELKNAVERAVVLGEAKLLSATSRPAASASAPAPEAGGDTGVFTVVTDVPYKDQKANVVADFEERYVRVLLKKHAGNVSAAAREAGIDRMSLHKILQRYDLDAKALAKEAAT
jgi:transcriptional regulator with GAF, ATPase, and Fis domain